MTIDRVHNNLQGFNQLRAAQMQSAMEHVIDTSKATRARGRIPPRVRRVVDRGKTYVAISANDLLEFDSIGDRGRPGLLY